MPTGNYFLDTYHSDETVPGTNYFLDKYHNGEDAKTTTEEPSYVSKLGQKLLSAYESMPSWLEKATEQSKKDISAYKEGGVPSLMAETKPTQELAGGFFPVQTPIKAPPVPSAGTLTDVGGNLIEKARTSNLKYAPQAASDATAYVTNKLGPGIDSDVAPKTFTELGKLNKLSDSTDPIDFQKIHNVRLKLEKVQDNTAKEGSTDYKAATTAKHALDDWLENPNPAQVVQGNPQEVGSMLREGNLTYMAGKQAEGLSKKEYRAFLRTASANSGMNKGNTIKSNVTSLLLSPESRGWSPEIRAQAERMVFGTVPENTLRRVGNELAGGGGPAQLGLAALGGFLGYGASGGEPIATGLGVGIPMGLGVGAKTAANELAVMHLKRLSEMLRSQAPISQAAAKQYYPGNTGVAAAQQALIRALLGNQSAMQ